MKLWTLCDDRTKWRNRFTLYKCGTMGNICDRIEEDPDSPLFRKEYPDDFLAPFSDISETYVIHVDEKRVYDNDDYNIYDESTRKYFKDIVLGPTTVIANGRPVGELIESTSYAGGMCNMSWREATIIFYVKPDAEAGETFSETSSESSQSGRTSYYRDYTVVKRDK